jgi:ribose transport system substrate-binding protein
MVGPETYDPKAERDEFLKATQRQIKPAGMLVSAADPALMRDVIDSAVDAGIPVITIDADSPGSKRLTFVGTNNYQAGQMGGEILAKELGGKGSIIVYTRLARQPRRAIGGMLNFARHRHQDPPGHRCRGRASKPRCHKDGNRKEGARRLYLSETPPRRVADVLIGPPFRQTLITMDDRRNRKLMQKGMIRATIAQKPYTHGISHGCSMTSITANRRTRK